MPKFVQTGELQVISKNLQYLVIRIVKLNVFEAIAAMGELPVWTDVEWGGVSKRSKKTKRPQLSETFHFQLAISEKTLTNSTPGDLADLIIAELRTKPEIRMSVWADLNNG